MRSVISYRDSVGFGTHSLLVVHAAAPRAGGFAPMDDQARQRCPGTAPPSLTMSGDVRRAV